MGGEGRSGQAAQRRPPGTQLPAGGRTDVKWAYTVKCHRQGGAGGEVGQSGGLEPLVTVLEPSMGAEVPRWGSGQGRESQIALWKVLPGRRRRGTGRRRRWGAWVAVQAGKGDPSCRAMAEGLERRGGHPSRRRHICRT